MQIEEFACHAAPPRQVGQFLPQFIGALSAYQIVIRRQTSARHCSGFLQVACMHAYAPPKNAYCFTAGCLADKGIGVLNVAPSASAPEAEKDLLYSVFRIVAAT